MKRKLVVFLRHYNDIDHIIPVVYHILSTRKNVNIDIVLRNKYQFKHVTEYSFSDDYRIAAVNKFANCDVHYLSDIAYNAIDRAAGSAKDDVLVPQIKSFGRNLPTSIPRHVWDTIIGVTPSEKKDWEKIAERTYQELLAGENDITVVFDWETTPTGLGKFVDTIVRMSNKDGHKTVCLPHGDAPYINYWGANKTGLIKNENFGDKPIQNIYYPDIEINYDYFVVPNKLVESRFQETIAPEIEILGSPRFNKAWIQILSDLAPDFNPSIEHQQWNVVFFTRQPSFNVSQDALAEAIRILAQFQSFSTVVKHHTRSINDDLNRAFRNQTGSDINDTSGVQLVSDDAHSVSLYEWGDLFIDVGVSIIFEAIVRDKPVLELEYTHWNESTVAHYLSESAVKSRDDFYEYLRQANKNPRSDTMARTYSPEERMKFMNTIIHPYGKDVLDAYAELLIN